MLEILGQNLMKVKAKYDALYLFKVIAIMWHGCHYPFKMSCGVRIDSPQKNNILLSRIEMKGVQVLKKN